MENTINCGHEHADWPVDGENLCAYCLLALLLTMDAHEDLLGDLRTEVSQ